MAVLSRVHMSNMLGVPGISCRSVLVGIVLFGLSAQWYWMFRELKILRSEVTSLGGAAAGGASMLEGANTYDVGVFEETTSYRTGLRAGSYGTPASRALAELDVRPYANASSMSGCVIMTATADMTLALDEKSCNGRVCPPCFALEPRQEDIMFTFTGCSSMRLSNRLRLGAGRAQRAIQALDFINMNRTLSALISDGNTLHSVQPSSALRVFCDSGGGDIFYGQRDGCLSPKGTVWINLDGTSASSMLNMAEIEVFDKAGNMLTIANSAQSSVYGGQGASNCHDGDYDNMCKTATWDSTWWTRYQVNSDLGVDRIKLYNVPQAAWAPRMRGVVVSVRTAADGEDLWRVKVSQTKSVYNFLVCT
eukprot:TRINITY_DN29999_c0_g1_i1.p1 TRINITY_DN29999_c0_g1~~TRINITY_DN29999_c0_g1_i1.p1  ORF type:complete len:379 (-),score=19.72 TRINITY_DN29999_c0_g1_i1:196-1287(-)